MIVEITMRMAARLIMGAKTRGRPVPTANMTASSESRFKRLSVSKAPKKNAAGKIKPR
jgi:hypothetical protein